MTSKGQVTIPLDLRERFSLAPGAEVEVVEADGGALVRPVHHHGSGSRLVARLRDRADGELSADEVLGLTRGDHV